MFFGMIRIATFNVFVFGVGRSKEVCVISLNPASRWQVAIVRMHRNKKIGLRLVRHSSPFVERNVIVAVARKNHVRAKAALKQLAQSLGNFEHNIFLEQATADDSSESPAALARGAHDAHL